MQGGVALIDPNRLAQVAACTDLWSGGLKSGLWSGNKGAQRSGGSAAARKNKLRHKSEDKSSDSLGVVPAFGDRRAWDVADCTASVRKTEKKRGHCV